MRKVLLVVVVGVSFAIPSVLRHTFHDTTEDANAAAREIGRLILDRRIDEACRRLTPEARQRLAAGGGCRETLPDRIDDGLARVLARGHYNCMAGDGDTVTLGAGCVSRHTYDSPVATMKRVDGRWLLDDW
jgi:pyruvate/2-oxoacid:ferredoxin oxidoreductase beta subunit